MHAVCRQPPTKSGRNLRFLQNWLVDGPLSGAEIVQGIIRAASQVPVLSRGCTNMVVSAIRVKVVNLGVPWYLDKRASPLTSDVVR